MEEEYRKVLDEITDLANQMVENMLNHGVGNEDWTIYHDQILPKVYETDYGFCVNDDPYDFTQEAYDEYWRTYYVPTD